MWLILCLDLEPTEASIYKAQPVEFAVTALLFDVTSHVLQEVGEFCPKLHNEKWSQVWESCVDWTRNFSCHHRIDRFILAGHNVAQFDVPILYQHCKRNYCDFFEIKWTHVLDTYRLAKKHWNLSDITDYTLSSVYQHVTGKELAQAHKAHIDAKAVATILQTRHQQEHQQYHPFAGLKNTPMQDIFKLVGNHARLALVRKAKIKKSGQEEQHRGLICRNCQQVVSVFFVHDCPNISHKRKLDDEECKNIKKQKFTPKEQMKMKMELELELEV